LAKYESSYDATYQEKPLTSTKWNSAFGEVFDKIHLIRTNYIGTAFPTGDDIEVGELVYRSDESSIYLCLASDNFSKIMLVSQLDATIHALSGKTTPVDADTIPLIDSADSNALKKVTWANIKSTLTASDVGLGNVTNDAQIAKSIGTTKGDIIGFSGSATPVRVAIGTNTYLLVADSGETPGLKWTNRITSLIEEVIKTSTGNLSTAEVSGTIINNYGQSNDVTLTLPTAAEGMSFMVVLGTTVAKYFRIKANTSDKIYLNGTAGTDNYYVGIASAEIGAMISFATFQTGASSYDWVATTISGTWEAQT